MSERLNCPYLSILPQGFRQPPAQVPVKFATYADLLSSFTDYAQVLVAQPTYESLLEGQPGYEGGVPPLPVGTGVEWGITRNGVEWWLIDAENVEGSAYWSPRVEEPTVGDGTWLLDVRAPGREMTVTGVLYADSPQSLATAVAEVGATLAAAPRTGWLQYQPTGGEWQRIAVALSGPTRVKRRGSSSADVQMSVRGIDVGSPGGGAHLESVALDSYTLGAETNIVVRGMVPTPPMLVLQGPLDAGVVVRLGVFTVTTTRAVLASQRVVIDCRQRLVVVNDAPDRSLIELDGGRWPVLPTGAVTVSATYTGSGQVTAEVTALW